MALFRDRTDAGHKLAEVLRESYAGRDDVVVLALPRGGVPVAFEVARALHAPLDVFLVRKLGVPGNEELAMGAIASGGALVINKDVMELLSLPQGAIAAAVTSEQRELARREQAYRDNRPRPEVRGRTVILVDDGLATGATMRAAVQALRTQQPAALVVAVPTAHPEVCDAFRDEVEDIICAATPEPFFGVGYWYDDFSQVSDDTVRALLAEAAEGWPAVAEALPSSTPV